MQFLTAERWVAGDTSDEGTEDGTDTNTSTSKTDGGQTGTLHLRGGHDGSGGGLGDNTTGLHGAANHVGGKIVASTVHEQTVADGRLAGLLEQGALDAGCF